MTKKQAKAKIHIAVPHHLMKAVRKVLQREGLDKLVEISDIRCPQISKPTKYLLTYDCMEEDNGRFHFALRGQSVLLREEDSASYVSYFLKEAIKKITFADIPGFTEEQNWNSTVNFIQA